MVVCVEDGEIFVMGGEDGFEEVLFLIGFGEGFADGDGLVDGDFDAFFTGEDEDGVDAEGAGGVIGDEVAEDHGDALGF